MGKQRIKPNYLRRVLRLPDLDHCKLAVLNSLGSPASRRVYEYAINQFIAWYCSEPRLALNRIVVVRYRMHLESRGLAANTINQQLAAVRRLAHEAADSGLLSPELAAGISRVKGVKQLGFRSGNLGHPVNDLFNLRSDVEPQEADCEAEAPKGFSPVETMSGSEIECRDGGSAHEHPIPVSHPLRVCQRERYDMVEVRESDRAQSLRRCSETGASRVDAGSKGDRRPDQAAVGPVGPAGISFSRTWRWSASSF